MPCNNAVGVINAIIKTVKFVKLISAVTAHRCTRRWFVQLRHMSLEQAQRELRRILRHLRLRIIGRLYVRNAFDESYHAILIACEVIRERNIGTFPVHVHELLSYYWSARCAVRYSAGAERNTCRNSLHENEDKYGEVVESVYAPVEMDSPASPDPEIGGN